MIATSSCISMGVSIDICPTYSSASLTFAGVHHLSRASAAFVPVYAFKREAGDMFFHAHFYLSCTDSPRPSLSNVYAFLSEQSHSSDVRGRGPFPGAYAAQQACTDQEVIFRCAFLANHTPSLKMLTRHKVRALPTSIMPNHRSHEQSSRS